MSETPSSTPQSRPPASDAPFRYGATLANDIEQRWQQRWLESNAFHTLNPGDEGFDPDQAKFYCLDMFPYPSGAGLHVGHPVGYVGSDIISRYRRMKGDNVLHPMGWDAFGLPAEQYAIATGVHPAETTSTAIDTYRRQLQSFGFSYDWSREFATIDDDYYHWTQWIWLQAWNAWYDEVEDRARPIDTLVAMLENNDASIDCHNEVILAPKGNGRTGWSDLDALTQEAALDTRRMAYLAHQTVNWCPMLGTVLANEEVIDGRSERGGHPVVRRPLQQWMFRITAFAHRLLEDLKDLDWPESTRAQQSEWIGRSEGAELRFCVVGRDDCIEVFTTRPDTIFGATFMVLAPEHPLVETVLQDSGDGTLRAYVEASRNRADVDRMADSKEKTGVPLGVDAINPATGQSIPIWVADYVLMGYGHGAVMAVPAHDQRDHDFAKKFGMAIQTVITPPEDAQHCDGCWSGDGVACNSASDTLNINGCTTTQAKIAVIDWAHATECGCGRTTWRLRDWLFSRQRYWGEPFPIVHTQDGRTFPVCESNLPVRLPNIDDYAPAISDDPQPLLGKVEQWAHTTAGEAGVDPNLLPPDTPVHRETNTMPGWAGSCWYHLRYCDPQNHESFAGEAARKYWLGPTEHSPGGVDLYIGGAEHAVLHLLYARFWHKLLFDLGWVESSEPFRRLFHQGMLTSFAYKRADGSLVPIDEVDEESSTETATGQPVERIIAKMSKSLRNVVNPDSIIAEYGADTFRLYEMYMGPLDASKPWNTRDIIGVHRFLQRLWRLVVDEDTGELSLRDKVDPDVERQLHRTIARVGDDIERLAYNTAIAAMIELVNAATSSGGLTADQLSRLIRVLSPFAPHITEELHAKLGLEGLCSLAPWPVFDESMLVDDTVELPIQIKGKVRAKITVASNAGQDTIQAAALADERVQALLQGNAPRKVIVVPGKIVNIIP